MGSVAKAVLQCGYWESVAITANEKIMYSEKKKKGKKGAQAYV